jgi:hypothetical protein
LCYLDSIKYDDWTTSLTPTGPVYVNHLGVKVELRERFEDRVFLLRLRNDGQRMRGRQETFDMDPERFFDLYRPDAP